LHATLKEKYTSKKARKVGGVDQGRDNARGLIMRSIKPTAGEEKYRGLRRKELGAYGKAGSTVLAADKRRGTLQGTKQQVNCFESKANRCRFLTTNGKNQKRAERYAGGTRGMTTERVI